MVKRLALLTLMTLILSAFLIPAFAQKKPGSDRMKKEHSFTEGMKMRLEAVNAEDIRGTSHNGPAVGEIAPDFSLTPLKSYEINIEEKEITEENAGERLKPVRLSDFKGKRPVALIFGSYT